MGLSGLSIVIIWTAGYITFSCCAEYLFSYCECDFVCSIEIDRRWLWSRGQYIETGSTAPHCSTTTMQKISPVRVTSKFLIHLANLFDLLSKRHNGNLFHVVCVSRPRADAQCEHDSSAIYFSKIFPSTKKSFWGEIQLEFPSRVFSSAHKKLREIAWKSFNAGLWQWTQKDYKDMSVAIHERIEDMHAKEGEIIFLQKPCWYFWPLTERKMVKSQFFRQKIVWLLFPRNILDTTVCVGANTVLTTLKLHTAKGGF